MHRSLREIENSTISLKNAVIKNEGILHRTINYEISRICKGVKFGMTGQNRYINVHIDDCEKNRIFLMVPIKSLCNLPGVVLFNEDGKLMTQ